MDLIPGKLYQVTPKKEYVIIWSKDMNHGEKIYEKEIFLVLEALEILSVKYTYKEIMILRKTGFIGTLWVNEHNSEIIEIKE